MRPLVLLALALLVSTPAVAQLPDGDVVDITAVRTPDLVVVEHAFGVGVDLVNRGNEDVTVTLATFLYVHEEGRTCGNENDERFLGRIDRGATPSLSLRPRETRSFPPEGAAAWHHVVNVTQVPVSGVYQACVFVLEPGTPTAVGYHDHFDLLLDVRASNALPPVDFSWGPEQGNVTTEFTFTALHQEDPEGDALTFTWDFGHLDTKGRATATGAVVTHRFFHFAPDVKPYDVTLTVSDGFAEAERTRTVMVDPEGTPRPQKVDLDGGEESVNFLTRLLPGPAAVTTASLAALAAVALARGRRAGFR